MDAPASDFAPHSVTRARPTERLQAVDVVRGLVITLMAVDHSSGAFNAGRIFSDGAGFYQRGTALPADQFLTRWITHLCAPTFVFLAGLSLALSVSRHIARGDSALRIDGQLVSRGLVILLFELWPSYFWMKPGVYLFQVLYAIGASFVFMAPLRRLRPALLAVVALSILVFGEALTAAMGWDGSDKTPLLAQLLLVPGRREHLVIGYPALPWLAIMIFGWLTGLWLQRRPAEERVRSAFFVGGAALLALFAALRGINGYGNMFLYREDGSLVQWLHVSKYPPALTYASLELGLAGLFLALAFVATSGRPVSARNPLLVYGRTPMLFYLLHIPVLHYIAVALGVESKLGLGATYGFALLVAVLLYPACLWYGRYKAAHASGWTRYL